MGTTCAPRAFCPPQSQERHSWNDVISGDHNNIYDYDNNSYDTHNGYGDSNESININNHNSGNNNNNNNNSNSTTIVLGII